MCEAVLVAIEATTLCEKRVFCSHTKWEALIVTQSASNRALKHRERDTGSKREPATWCVFQFHVSGVHSTLSLCCHETLFCPPHLDRRAFALDFLCTVNLNLNVFARKNHVKSFLLFILIDIQIFESETILKSVAVAPAC